MFRLTKILGGRINQPEPTKLPSTASETYAFGEALVLTNGKLTKCGATAKPGYIAGEDYAAPADANRGVWVYPVTDSMIFACPIGAAPTSLTVGSRVTLSEDALGVSATTTSGVSELVDLSGATAAGDTVLVRFA